jgi:hypothetical protein
MGPAVSLSTEQAERIRKVAEDWRDIARNVMQREMPYEEASVEWLTGYIERMRKGLNEGGKADGFINMMGSFLGECLIRNIGGRWVLCDGMYGVEIDGVGTAFPHNKVAKQIKNGLEAGDSVFGFYQTMTVMRAKSKPPTPRQERLLKFYRDEGQRVFVLRQLDKQPDWREVFGFKDGWLNLQDSISPRLSVPLSQVNSFYVCAQDGKLLHTDWVEQEDFASLPADVMNQLRGKVAEETEAHNATTPATTPVANRAHYIDPMPAQPEMEKAITGLRESFAPVQKRLNANMLKSICAVAPRWMQEDDGLYEILRQQTRLLTEGRIVWGTLIQANSQLFEPGQVDCPGLLVYSTDPYFDAHPRELLVTGRKIFSIKGTQPTDPALKAAADLVTDEMDRSMGFKLPTVFSDKQLSATAFMVFRQHIPKGVLTCGMFPVLTHPSTQALMIVPFEFWSMDMIMIWKNWEG